MPPQLRFQSLTKARAQAILHGNFCAWEGTESSVSMSSITNIR